MFLLASKNSTPQGAYAVQDQNGEIDDDDHE